MIKYNRPTGWTLIQKSLPRIIEYEHSEGIIKIPEHPVSTGNNLTRIIDAAQEEANARVQKNNDRYIQVNLPTEDHSLMHKAIPFLPVPIAITCLILNIVIPGSGTILSGICALCMGQCRIDKDMKEGAKIVTLIVNFLVGISQFFTITFLLVGWFWSITWGALITMYSMHYRKALQQQRKEAVTKTALQALTKDSILHRDDVKTLIHAHKSDVKLNKKQSITKLQSIHTMKRSLLSGKTQ